MPRLVSYGPRSAAKHAGHSMAIIGLGLGIIHGIGGVIYDFATYGLNKGTLLGLGAVLGMHAYFGAIGAVTGGLGALVYNRIAVRFGGIQMRFGD